MHDTVTHTFVGALIVFPVSAKHGVIGVSIKIKFHPEYFESPPLVSLFPVGVVALQLHLVVSSKRTQPPKGSRTQSRAESMKVSYPRMQQQQKSLLFF